MPKYFSPEGNLEVWDEKPNGYFTVEEWEEQHPPTPYKPTKEQQIETLTAEYRQEKANLCEAYTTATMTGDTETAQSIAQDMADLDAWFDEEYQKIEGSAE
jgi:hypothetical protein